MPYGVEAFCPTRFLLKENGKAAKVEETLDFKVIEFNKESKKIIVSHTDLVKDAANLDKANLTEGQKKDEAETKKATKKVKDSIEKTTLGDIDVLSNLKSDMEATEKKTEDDAREAKASE